MSDDQKTALELEREQFEKEAKEYNSKLSGIGLRQLVGATRGRSTVNIKYMAFDETSPDTLPKTVEKFVEITGIKSNAELAELLVTGFNDKAYTEASDPIAEHVNKAWKDDVKVKFRAVIRGLVATLPDMTIAKAVEMVRPGMDSNKENFATS